MNHCPICRNELPAKANFCGKCGFPLRKKASQTEKVLNVHLSQQSSPMTTRNTLTSQRNVVVKMKEQKKSKPSEERGFWFIVFLMICLIVGLGAYITSTYVSSPVSGTTHVAPADASARPTLSLQGPLSATVKQGQTLVLHGAQFRSNDPISFLLDFAVPIKDKNNQNISIRASSKGSFDVSIPIQGSDWSTSTHSLEGIDGLTKQNAYLTVAVTPAGVAETTSENLALSMQDDPVTTLAFQAVAGQGNPAEQRVTLTNTSNAPLSWTATVSADNGLSWLAISNNYLAGSLDVDGTDSIGISAFITGLKSNAHPYTGEIIFTINGQEQLTLPVGLQVVDAQSEIVFNPNPVAIVGAGGTCPGTTFTLSNVGVAFINWTLVSSAVAQNHIRFTVKGQSVTQGQLTSSGVAGDTQVLNLECTGVSPGESYDFVIYAGPIQSPITIVIQAPY